MPQNRLGHHGLSKVSGVVRLLEAGEGSRAIEALGHFDFNQWAQDVAEGVGTLVTVADGGAIQDTQQAIGHLEALEEEVSECWETLKRHLDIPLPSLRFSITRVLRSYRDGRWQLMAIQAEKEPSGDAPVFDDADALISYLKS